MADTDKPIFGFDDPNRGPVDRAANALTGDTGGISGAMDGTSTERAQGDRIGTVSAIFDSNAEAQFDGIPHA